MRPEETLIRQTPVILIVEDDEDIRSLYTKMISATSMRAITAPNIREGLKKAKEYLPDGAIVDVNLGPDGDGLQFLEQAHRTIDPTMASCILSIQHLVDSSVVGEESIIGWVSKADIGNDRELFTQKLEMIVQRTARLRQQYLNELADLVAEELLTKAAPLYEYAGQRVQTLSNNVGERLGTVYECFQLGRTIGFTQGSTIGVSSFAYIDPQRQYAKSAHGYVIKKYTKQELDAALAFVATCKAAGIDHLRPVAIGQRKEPTNGTYFGLVPLVVGPNLAYINGLLRQEIECNGPQQQWASKVKTQYTDHNFEVLGKFMNGPRQKATVEEVKERYAQMMQHTQHFLEEQSVQKRICTLLKTASDAITPKEDIARFAAYLTERVNATLDATPNELFGALLDNKEENTTVQINIARPTFEQVYNTLKNKGEQQKIEAKQARCRVVEGHTRMGHPTEDFVHFFFSFGPDLSTKSILEYYERFCQDIGMNESQRDDNLQALATIGLFKATHKIEKILGTYVLNNNKDRKIYRITAQEHRELSDDYVIKAIHWGEQTVRAAALSLALEEHGASRGNRQKYLCAIAQSTDEIQNARLELPVAERPPCAVTEYNLWFASKYLCLDTRMP